MPRGLPDYSEYPELSERMGSILSLDRRGDVFFLEDFAQGVLAWQTALVGTGASVALDTVRYRSKGFSCLHTTGSTGTGETSLYRYFPIPVYSGIGLEVSFSPHTFIGNIRFIMHLQTAAMYRRFEARFNRQTSLLEILEATGLYFNCNFPYTLPSATHLWHTLKLVGNYKTNMYMRLLLNDFTIDLSTHACRTVLPGGPAYLMIEIDVFPDPVANRKCWLDNIIITQSED